jgi:hypothetical protein
MSIALSVRSSDLPLETTKIVPIATSDAFKNYWIPISRSLKLVWIPLFETGVPINSEDVNDILSELYLIKTHLAEQSCEASEAIATRLNRLIEELESVAGKRDLDVYIG